MACARSITSSAASLASLQHGQKALFPFSDDDRIGRDPGRAQPEQQQLPRLFTPLRLRSLELKNRLYVAPMCQYSSHNGFFSDYHLVHLGQFALGGAGLITTEATAVSADGRISPEDAGLYLPEHVAGHKRIVDFCHAFNTPMSIQLSHAGRKASTFSPFAPKPDIEPGQDRPRAHLHESEGGWEPKGPSAVSWGSTYRVPHELSVDEIWQIIEQFGEATKRANDAGYDVVEIHGAHGYLIFEFLSATSNRRTDDWGGSLANRTRFALEVTKKVRANWPEAKPLIFRLSCIEWLAPESGGWTIEDSCHLAAQLHALGVDMLHASSGGNSSAERITIGPGYQVPFAAAIKKQVPDLLVGAVGLITDGQQAEDILQNESADCIFVARELLRDPHFPMRAAAQLGAKVQSTPQYARAF